MSRKEFDEILWRYNQLKTDDERLWFLKTFMPYFVNELKRHYQIQDSKSLKTNDL